MILHNHNKNEEENKSHKRYDINRHILDEDTNMKKMVLTFHQTFVGFTSANKITYSDKGSESVPVPIVDDKRRITAALSLPREVLRIKLIYGGLTGKCKPGVKFPIYFMSLTQTAIGQMKKIVLDY